MASEKEIKRRIVSVKNTMQITRAMKMVAAAKLRRSQDAITQARPYAKSIKQVMVRMGGSADDEMHPLFKNPTEPKKLNIILVSSDKGLCGGFNSSLFKLAEKTYQEEKSNFESISFTCLGKKGYEYLSHRKYPIHKNHEDFSKNFDFAKVDAITGESIQSFLDGEFDQVRIIYSEFRSAISQIATLEKLLPLSFDDVEAEESAGGADFIYEPNQNEILVELLPRYLKTQVYRAVLESFASEHGARMAAMDNATKNASEMVDSLSLLANKLRQAGITSELLEITAGAEALK